MVEILSSQPVPDGLLEAFWAYDRALLANDTTTLAALFAPGADTLRGDGRRVLVGHAQITGYRSSRVNIPTRRVTRVHVRPIDAGTALIMAETRAPDGAAAGLQTQLWQAIDGSWRVCAAHVTLPNTAPALDRRVWRVLGDPLLPAASPGPLHGHTVAVKDVFAVRGHPIGAGNPTWLAEAPNADEHAAVVAALLHAGADIVGIARTDEFAYSLAGTNAHYGTPPNPAAPDRIPGGSSSGPASAVASGQVSIGLGTDTAGSIRLPASYQGLFGLRTTHGLLDTAGLLALAPSFDTVGWLSRDARTLAAVADVLLPLASRTPITRGLVLPTVTAGADEPVHAAFTDAINRLADRALLSEVDTVDLHPAVLDGWCAAFRTVQAHQAWQQHGEWVSTHPHALGPDVTDRFALAATITTDEAARASTQVARARAELRALLAPGVALMLPSASSVAPSRDTEPGSPTLEAARTATIRLTCLASLAGVPAVSMPLAQVDGLPAGVSALAAPRADRDLVDLAERATGA